MSKDSHTHALAHQLTREGELKIRPLGVNRRFGFDLYHRLMRLSWPRLIALFVAVFLGFNLLFAAIYWLNPHGLATSGRMVDAPLFWRDFFFSVDTVATIGYVNVYPVSLWANVAGVVEITCGILYFSLATGIAFARFSRPTARILFSKVLIVREVDGVPMLMLRAANQRHNTIYSAEARLSLLTDEDVGGVTMRRFVDLPLARASNPTFSLTWTIMHRIDADSPLAGWLVGREGAGDDALIVTLAGTDAVSGQLIHGRWAYAAGDIHWGARFADIIDRTPDGWRTIDYRHFHDVVEAP